MIVGITSHMVGVGRAFSESGDGEGLTGLAAAEGPVHGSQRGQCQESGQWAGASPMPSVVLALKGAWGLQFSCGMEPGSLA